MNDNVNGSTPTPAEIQAKIQEAGMAPPPLDMNAPAQYVDTRNLQEIIRYVGQNIVFDQAAPLLGMIQSTFKPLAELPKETPPDG